MSHSFQHTECSIPWTVQATWGWVLYTLYKNARILSLDANTKALEDSTTVL
jgi:hypothetical protein